MGAEQLDKEFNSVKNSLVNYAETAAKVLNDFGLAIKNQNYDDVLKFQGQCNDLEKTAEEFEEHCMRILALHQPVAIDLRQTMLLYKVGQDFERIAALMSKISFKFSKLAGKPTAEVSEPYKKEIDRVLWMVESAAKILSTNDIELASQVVSANNDVNHLKKFIRKDIEKTISGSKDSSRTLFILLGILRHYVRIADLASDSAEDIQEFLSQDRYLSEV